MARVFFEPADGYALAIGRTTDVADPGPGGAGGLREDLSHPPRPVVRGGNQALRFGTDVDLARGSAVTGRRAGNATEDRVFMASGQRDFLRRLPNRGHLIDDHHLVFAGFGVAAGCRAIARR